MDFKEPIQIILICLICINHILTKDNNQCIAMEVDKKMFCNRRRIVYKELILKIIVIKENLFHLKKLISTKIVKTVHQPKELIIRS